MSPENTLKLSRRFTDPGAGKWPPGSWESGNVIVKVWPKSGNGMPFRVTAEVVVQTGDGEIATSVKQPVVLNSESWKSSLLTHGAGGAVVVDVVVGVDGA